MRSVGKRSVRSRRRRDGVEQLLRQRQVAGRAPAARWCRSPSRARARHASGRVSMRQQVEQHLLIEPRTRCFADRGEPRADPFGRIVADALDFDGVARAPSPARVRTRRRRTWRPSSCVSSCAALFHRFGKFRLAANRQVARLPLRAISSSSSRLSVVRDECLERLRQSRRRAPCRATPTAPRTRRRC